MGSALEAGVGDSRSPPRCHLGDASADPMGKPKDMKIPRIFHSMGRAQCSELGERKLQDGKMICTQKQVVRSGGSTLLLYCARTSP